MAAKTKLSDATLRKICSQYDVGEFKRSKPFKAGYVQTNIMMTTTAGRFVLRYYENRSRESVRYEADLLWRLQKERYPSPAPVKDRKNEVIGMYRGKPFILFTYLEGRHVKSINSKQLHELVKHLAIFHKIGESFRPRGGLHREQRTKKFCLDAAKTEAKRFKDKGKGAARLQLIKERLGELEIPRNLPRGPIHGDFEKANLKFVGDKLSGVLDFDDSTTTFLIYDLGVVLLYWTRFYVKKFDLAKARRIVQIYEKHRPLTKAERKHLFDAIQFHALMIMSWLMYDKWKGKDLFKILAGILEELDAIGRQQFYKRLFG